jgi:hypothetical protein
MDFLTQVDGLSRTLSLQWLNNHCYQLHTITFLPLAQLDLSGLPVTFVQTTVQYLQKAMCMKCVSV